MKCNKAVLLMCSATVLSLLVAAEASAAFVLGDVINIDLNSPNNATTHTGAAAYDDPDTGAAAYWNGFTGNPSSQGLYDADGVGDGLTGITLTTTAQNHWRSGTYGTGNNLLYDYLFRQPGSGPNVTATLNNVPAGDYKLYVYCFSQYTENSSTPVTVNGDLKTLILDGDGNSGTADATFGYSQGVTYEVFDVTLASPGSIQTVVSTATYLGGGNRDAILNGMQLQSVPEPSTFLLSALGLLGLLGFTRRMRRTKN